MVLPANSSETSPHLPKYLIPSIIQHSYLYNQDRFLDSMLTINSLQLISYIIWFSSPKSEKIHKSVPQRLSTRSTTFGVDFSDDRHEDPKEVASTTKLNDKLLDTLLHDVDESFCNTSLQSTLSRYSCSTESQVSSSTMPLDKSMCKWILACRRIEKSARRVSPSQLIG